MPASFFDDMRAFYSRFSYHPVFSQNVKQEAGILSRRCLLFRRRVIAFFFQDFFSSRRKQDGTTTTTDGRAPCLRANLEELPDWASLPSMTKPPSSRQIQKPSTVMPSRRRRGGRLSRRFYSSSPNHSANPKHHTGRLRNGGPPIPRPGTQCIHAPSCDGHRETQSTQPGQPAA